MTPLILHSLGQAKILDFPYDASYDAIGYMSALERLGGLHGGRLVIASQRAGSPPESPARYGLGARRRAGQGSRP